MDPGVFNSWLAGKKSLSEFGILLFNLYPIVSSQVSQEF